MLGSCDTRSVGSADTRLDVGDVAAPRHEATVIVDGDDADASAIPQRFLDVARTKKVLFNHQSVGANLLSGIDTLAAADATRYSVVRTSNPTPTWYGAPTSGVGDFTKGSNGDPKSKIAGFDALVRELGYGAHVDMALMKFCYVDMRILKPQTLWDRYRTTMQALQREYPDVTFVWTTVPLTARHNPDQMLVNDAIRRYVQANGGVLFDLAALESVTPAGSVATGNDGAPRLASEYDSGDGGHLNETGRVRLASAWWQLLARIAGWDGAPA